MSKPLMQCGHTAQGTDASTGKPVCVICVGIGDLDAKARTVREHAPELTGRTAKCAYCHLECASDYDLAFFAYEPAKEFDSYYCGCRGWD